MKHDAFRRLPGSWDGAIRATRVLTDAGLDFSLHMSVTDWNVAEVPAMIDLAQQLGAKVLNFFFLVRTGRGRDLTDIDAAAYERILTYLAKAQGAGQRPAGVRPPDARPGAGPEPGTRSSRTRGRRRSGAPTGCSFGPSARPTSGGSCGR